MSLRVFLSYSFNDGIEFARDLLEIIEGTVPKCRGWFAERDMTIGSPWDIQIRDAIRNCNVLLFVATEDSVEDSSVCYEEWTLALKYKMQVIPILTASHIELPFRLHQLQYIDFSQSSAAAASKLTALLMRLSSPAGELQRMQTQLEEAKRDLRRFPDSKMMSRIQSEITQLEHDIEYQEMAIKNPEKVAQDLEQFVETGITLDRQAPTMMIGTKSKYLTPPLVKVPPYFQDRDEEIARLNNLMKLGTFKLITIVGRGGVGKSTLIHRWLETINHDLPHLFHVDRVIFLSNRSAYRISFSSIFALLSKCLSKKHLNTTLNIYNNPALSIKEKIEKLLVMLRGKNILLVLENFEDCLDPETRNVRDADLDEALKAILAAPLYDVVIIVSTQVPPLELGLYHPHLQKRIDLDDGLESPFAEMILKQMDSDGKLGLKDANGEILAQTRVQTRGFPRALEALFAALSTDRYTSIEELLTTADRSLPQNVVEVLIGEAFSRLELASQRVMQAISIYGRPVSITALAYLLQPFLTVNITSIMSRLVNLKLVQKRGQRFFLDALDQTYIFNSISEDKADLFNRAELLHRAADYYAQIRKPNDQWKTIADLEPQFAEFELLFKGGDFEQAYSVVRDIDEEYLYRWGYFREIIQLYEQLANRITAPDIEFNRLLRLGNALRRLGRSDEAIKLFEKSLGLAKSLKISKYISASLSHLAAALLEIGDFPQSLSYLNESLIMLRQEISDWRLEAFTLGAIAYCHRSQGETKIALNGYISALDLVTENDGGEAEQANYFDNIGFCYFRLGDFKRAYIYYERALHIFQINGNRPAACVVLYMMADLLSFEDRFQEALKLCQEAINISDVIEVKQTQNESRAVMALLQLLAGDKKSAYKHIREAAEFSYPINDHSVSAISGIVNLYLGDRLNARIAFENAISQAETRLRNSERSFTALNTRGISICGLILADAPIPIIEAVETFRTSRAINSDLGVLRTLARLLHLLLQVDKDNRLEEIRSFLCNL